MRRAWRVVSWASVAVAVTVAALATAGWWTVRSERGSAWLLSQLPGVQVEGARGPLLGDFDAQREVVQLPGGTDSLTLSGLAWRGLRITRAPAPLWLKVDIASLDIARVDLVLAPAKSSAPMHAPADLRLPVELDLRSLHIVALHATALGDQPVRELRARLHLGANGGAEHRLDDLALAWDRLQLTGDAHVASDGPMTLAASLRLAQQAAADLPPWDASATLAGPLAAPLLNATLRAAAAAGRPAQTLDAHATLRPFAPWPLGELQASAQGLDLSAFSSAAPSTALSGQATATTTAANAPATLTLALNNALSGRWNEGRLPVHRVVAELVGRPDQPDALTLQQLTAELGTPKAGAGRLTAQGRWSPTGWALTTTLSDVQPALLDARAPAMRLGGPLTGTGTGGGGADISVKADLGGQVSGLRPARNVQLKLDATLATTADSLRVELRDLQALAGGARAQVSGRVTHAANDAPWVVKAKAALVDFDPALWWPGRDDSPWRQARNRLNATGDADLSLPAAMASREPLEALAALHGQAALTLQPSQLAGVPLTGAATLRSGANAQAAATLELVAEGNTVRASGRLATTGRGAGDAWDVSVDGPALARLAPVFQLLQPAGSDATLAGTLTATAHVTGRWPALATQGQLDANALRVGALSVQKAQARWSLGTAANASVEATLTLADAGLVRGAAPGPSLASAQLQLQGTARAHTLELRADSKARPPAWVDAVQAARASDNNAHTVATLQAQGGLVDLPGAALGGWRGTVKQLELRSNPSAPVLSTRDVAIDAVWAGAPARVTVQPGHAELLGGAVRWSRIAWQAAAREGGYAQIEADAELEPLRIAPLLARVQPDFCWGGDLTVAAHIKLRSAPTFSAEIVIERSTGDLTVTEDEGTRALGLTDLRLGLAAENGVWNFTQGLAGSAVGVAAGAVVVRTDPLATWPPADAPIQGVLELQVADLGTWGTWVPPGWRLAGALRTSAGIAGRFGAPEYTGEMQGTRLGVRNFLQGVNVSDGDVAISLQGTTARIERFTAKAGNGSITLAGDASLGETPKAVLQIVADHFQLLGRVDRRIVVSGQGTLQLDAKSLAFDGQFGVDEGLIDFTRSDAPTLSGDVEVVRAKGAVAPADAASAAASAAPLNPAREVALDVRVGLGDKLRLRGRGLDTGLSGDLRITSPGGRLAVNGSVRATDGTYKAYGQKLSIDRGLITFNGSIDNPRLDIEATRPNLDVRVGVAVSGSATNPRVRLFSEPELSEIDKLSWLVMGRASDGLGRTDTALLQRAALALLAGEGDSPTDQFTKAIGLDEIGVRQQTDGEVRETVVSLGKQLSRRWYVGYERGLNATSGNFQLIYRIAQRFTLRAQSGDDNSLDLIWTWRWK